MEYVTWQAPEFKKYEKPKSWFIALWIIIGGLVVVSFLTKSLFMGILVVVGGLVVSLFAAKEPRMLSITLTEESIAINEKIYPLDDFTSFWIFERPDYLVLSLASRGFRPYSKVILPPEKASSIRLLLRARVEEQEQEESLIETLAEWMRF